MKSIKQLTRKRAIDEVYEILKEAILSKLFQPGERLDVAELAQKLGVSVTPVRAALELLATQGLVEIRPRSGTFVAKLSVRDLEETFEVRLALESFAAELAINRVTPELIARMRELAQRLAIPPSTSEGRLQHDQENIEFHRLLVRASGNRKLLEIYDELHLQIQIARVHASETDWTARLEREKSEHLEIVDALEAKDLPRLQKAIRNHLQRAKEDLIRALTESGG